MLVVVLVTLLFATAALVAFIDKAADDLVVASRESTDDRLRPEAYSALNVVLAVLEDFRIVNGGLRSPAEGWGDPLEFAGWEPRPGCEVQVTFQDESAKISLPKVEAATLMNLFDAWGITQNDAEQLVDALFSWMKKDYVPRSSWSSDYERGAIPYEPPLRSLRSYGELAAIDVAQDIFYDEKGRPNLLWDRFTSAISLLEFAQTNLNGASGDVLAALGVSDPTQQQRIAEYVSGTGSREYSGPGYFETPTEVSALIGSGSLPASAGTQISALRVNIALREGGTVFRLSVVIAPPGGATPVPASTGSQGSDAAGEERGEPGAGPANAPKAGVNGDDDSKKIKYPFTLLEIRENAEISTPPVDSTKA